MFEAGDKIVCINDSSIKKKDEHWKTHLTNGKTYKIQYISHIDSKINKSFITINNDRGIDMIYSNKRFISLIEWRKLKLKKICSKLEMK